MANARIIHSRTTRDSITITWNMVEGACAYSIARLGPIGDNNEEPQRTILAAVYETVFCDVGLSAGSRYRYRLTMQPLPNTDPQPAPDVQTIEARTLPPTVYATSREFFTKALRGWYCRNTEASMRWCPEWWLHPEAAARVEALWMAWEQCHHDGGTAPAAWWVSYADPNMREMFEPQATFAGCAQDRGHKPANEPLPDGWTTR